MPWLWHQSEKNMTSYELFVPLLSRISPKGCGLSASPCLVSFCPFHSTPQLRDTHTHKPTHPNKYTFITIYLFRWNDIKRNIKGNLKDQNTVILLKKEVYTDSKQEGRRKQQYHSLTPVTIRLLTASALSQNQSSVPLPPSMPHTQVIFLLQLLAWNIITFSQAFSSDHFYLTLSNCLLYVLLLPKYYLLFITNPFLDLKYDFQANLMHYTTTVTSGHITPNYLIFKTTVNMRWFWIA